MRVKTAVQIGHKAEFRVVWSPRALCVHSTGWKPVKKAPATSTKSMCKHPVVSLAQTSTQQVLSPAALVPPGGGMALDDTGNVNQ